MDSEPSAAQIGAYLEDRARRLGAEGIVHYNDLAVHFDLPPVDERWAQHPFCRLFDELDREDTRNKRPFRTALVVSKEKSVPGQGFFNTAGSLRQPRPRLSTEMERMKFFLDELHALAKFYSGK